MTQSTREATLRSRFAQAESLATELSQLGELRRLERHPFLRRWLAGELTHRDLQIFAAEHHHAVCVLEDVARRAAAMTGGLLAEQLVRYADDQEEAVELSCVFASAAGWGPSAWYFASDPLPETLACERAWRRDGDSLVRCLVTIHAIESEHRLLAPRQLAALIEHYGFGARSVRGFALRAERSPSEVSLTEAALTSLLPVGRPDALVRRAVVCHRGYAELLDGVQQLSLRAG